MLHVSKPLIKYSKRSIFFFFGDFKSDYLSMKNDWVTWATTLNWRLQIKKEEDLGCRIKYGDKNGFDWFSWGLNCFKLWKGTRHSDAINFVEIHFRTQAWRECLAPLRLHSLTVNTWTSRSSKPAVLSRVCGVLWVARAQWVRPVCHYRWFPLESKSDFYWASGSGSRKINKTKIPPLGCC